MPDGHLKIYMHRYPDKEATIAMRRTIGPSAMGISVAEARQLRAAIDLFEEQLAVAPYCEGSHSSLDLGLLVEITKEPAA